MWCLLWDCCYQFVEENGLADGKTYGSVVVLLALQRGERNIPACTYAPS